MTRPATNEEDGIALLPAPLRAVAESGVERRYRKGTILIEEGEPGGLMYFIVKGKLRAYSAAKDGHEFTYGYYGPGEYMGELSLDGGPRSASVIVEDSAVCRIVSRQQLERCIAADPTITFELMSKVIRLARVRSTRARDLALNDAYGRLVQLLREGSEPQPDGTHLMRNALTQEQLAQQVGCSRTMVTKLLGELVKGGWLQLDNRHWRTLKTLPPKF
jgi:CRP/FNR family cyclic AMP-dependent transcriptional regulator